MIGVIYYTKYLIGKRSISNKTLFTQHRFCLVTTFSSVSLRSYLLLTLITFNTIINLKPGFHMVVNMS